jgi:hypothetical protein
MPEAQEPQSLLTPPHINEWLAQAFSPSSATAQGAPPAWSLIGPAPFRPGPPYSTNRWTGFIGQIAIHPTAPAIVYTASYGGVWKTTNGGTTWSPMTTNHETQMSNVIALNPCTPSIVYAGTGYGFFTDVPRMSNLPVDDDLGQPALLGRGLLRSLDGGNTWCRIGPPWPLNESNQNSHVGLFNITTDASRTSNCTQPNNVRVYAATDRGLFWSENTHLPDCSQVTWTHLSRPTNPTGLPTLNGQPDRVTAIAVGKWSNQKLYATIFTNTNPPNNNGFYRSTNGGASWTRIQGPGTGLANDMPLRYTLTVVPNPPITNVDVLYVSGAQQVQCPTSYSKETVYRSIDSGLTWAALQNPGDPCQPLFNLHNNGGIRSLDVHLTNPNVVIIGADCPHLSTDGGTTATDMCGTEGMHPDQNDIEFGPAPVPDLLYVGNDGGIWRRTDYTTGPFQHRNGNLANVLFYNGTIDMLNPGMSWGGTQDNGDIKGGNEVLWNQVQGGDGSGNIVDFTNSNVAYFTNRKTTDGGLTTSSLRTCDLRFTCEPTGDHPNAPCSNDQECGTSAPCKDRIGPMWGTMQMDSANNLTLAIGGQNGKIYRTTNGGESTCSPSGLGWTNITTTPASIPSLRAITIAPSQSPPNPSTMMFAGGFGTVWRTTNLSTWTAYTSGLASRYVETIAVAPGTCTATTCTLYAGVSGFDDTESQPRHIFRSTNAGQSWTQINGSGVTAFPNVPVNRIVVHPTDPTVVWVATDLSVLQGCLSANGSACSPSGSTWIWTAYNNNLPAGILVNDLVLHKESGLLRAFTFGRSTWETQALTPAHPDVRVNTTEPVTGVKDDSVRIGSGTGAYYSVSWLDDRLGTNNWHLYYRGYGYDGNGNPSSLDTDWRVDHTSNTRPVQTLSLSAHPTQTSLPYCSRLAWNDDRNNPAGFYDVFTQYICSNGYKLWGADVLVDEHSSVLKTYSPAIVFQPSLDFAVTWHVDRGQGSSVHDIYARFFGLLGLPKGSQFKVSTTTSGTVDATAPAIAADSRSNVYIAWQEFDSSTSKGTLWIRKYNSSGTPLAGPTPINTSANATARNQAALAVLPSGTVIVTWWESKSDGTEPETILYRRLDSSLGDIDVAQVQVNQPPSVPDGVKRAKRVGIAADGSGNFTISWQANVNDTSAVTWNGFARNYDSNAATRKNDYRVDLTPRTSAALAPKVARAQSGKFSFAWLDSRTGKNEVYTRVP